MANDYAIPDPPRATSCPVCGTDPPEEMVDDAVTHDRLSASGYLHSDFRFYCQECREHPCPVGCHEGENPKEWGCRECTTSWVCGRPIGDFEHGRDLFCDACGSGFMLVHRVAMNAVPDADTIVLHLKCPHTGLWECDGCGVEQRVVGYTREGKPYCTTCGEIYDRDDLPGCFHFKSIERKGRKGTVLVGYPQITGTLDGVAKEYGYTDESFGD